MKTTRLLAAAALVLAALAATGCQRYMAAGLPAPAAPAVSSA